MAERWEYKVILLYKCKQDEIMTALNAEGAYGWELVTVLFDDGGYTRHGILKHKI